VLEREGKIKEESERERERERERESESRARKNIDIKDCLRLKKVQILGSLSIQQLAPFK